MRAAFLAIDMGKGFKGVYNLYRRELHLLTPGLDTRSREGIVINSLKDPMLDRLLGSQAEQLRKDVALLDGAVAPLIIWNI
ncbi:MAG: hypothetical protein ACP5SG_03620 [Dissulfurimicrobium sp.]|uniref:hypothetical protein n=1 Tax=Dissulfurimicrobium sp. TaxID=2022436 RepID=UPI003D0C9E02